MMLSSDIEIFSFPNWYPLFENASVESVILPITNDVLQYLRKGPLILPLEATSSARYKGVLTEQNYSVDWSEEEEEDGEDMTPPTFPKFSEALKEAINTVGGSAFVKSNWHAAKDALWIATGRTLKCTTIEDVYLLVKGSDIICKDLTYEFKSEGVQNQHCIVVKQWTNIHPGCEYRCFVKQHTLIGISQRDCSTFYPHINARRCDIIRDIVDFFQENIKRRFPSPDYVFDVICIDNNSLKIVDFQPYDKTYTEGLLFNWDDLSTLMPNEDCEESNLENPEFRFINEDPGVQPKPFAFCGMPYEVNEYFRNMSSVSMMELLLEEVREQRSGDN